MGQTNEESKTLLSAVFFAVTRAGTEWVLVFFVLSGFLVGGKVIERVAAGDFDLNMYVVDRLSRIWVPLVPALAWSAWVAYWVGKPLSWTGFWGNMFGLQGVAVRSFAGNYPLWSLSYEIWFYFLAGCLAVWVLADLRGRIVAGFAATLGFVIFTKLSVVFLFAWILGASTFWLSSKPRIPLLAVIGGIFIGAGYVFSQLNSATISVDMSAWLLYAPSSDGATLILSLGMALMLPYLVKFEPKTSWGVRLDRLGGKLAAFSYTMYLVHYPALYVWEHYMPYRHDMVGFASSAWYLLRIASCVACAWLLYLPFERQTYLFRRFLRKVWVDRSPSM